MKQRLNSRFVETLMPMERPYEIWDTETRNLVLRVQPSGVMTYYCSYRTSDGRKNRFRIGDAMVLSPSAARTEAQKILVSVIKGADPAAEKKALRATSLESFLTNHFEPWAKGHQKRGQATVDRIRVCFPGFLPKAISDITPWLVEKWRSDRMKAGIRPTTINRDVATLRSAFSKAKGWGMIPVHPLHDLKPLRTDRNSVIRFLAPDEETRLLQALEQREERMRCRRATANAWRSERGIEKLSDLNTPVVDYLKPSVLLSLNSGLRQGEVFQLEWTDIDFQSATLAVAGYNAKSGNTRHIPLNQVALSALLNWWTVSGSPSRGLVFPSANGKARTQIKSAWTKLLKDARIESFRWHDQRHHFASRLAMAGVALNTIRELLGHADIAMTLRYAHLSPDTRKDAVAKLNVSA